MQGSAFRERPPFREKPFIKIRGTLLGDEGRVKFEVNDEDKAILYRLVKAGYGSIREVKNLNVEEVVDALNYETFLIDYQKAYKDSLEKEK